MRTTLTENARSLDFLKIWNNVFARDLEYFVDKLHDSALLDPAARVEIEAEALLP